MCRNIRTLFNFEPPATDEEVGQHRFVRKLSGFSRPVANEAAFNRAVERYSGGWTLIDPLAPTAQPREERIPDSLRGLSVTPAQSRSDHTRGCVAVEYARLYHGMQTLQRRGIAPQ